MSAPALLLANAGWQVHAQGVENLFRAWRSWDDLGLASGFAAHAGFPVAPYRVRDTVRRDRDPKFRAYRSWLLATISESEIGPLQFWKTLRSDSAPPGADWLAARRFDDTGRALLAGMIFRALKGTAPFLIFWLAVLTTLPVLIWTAFEFVRANHPVAGAVFLLGLVCSAFVVELLLLGYSPAGFHLVALLTLVPLATYAVLGHPTIRGLILRAGAAGSLLGLCILCRATGVLLLPGFALALWIGASRASAVRGGTVLRFGGRAAVTGAGLCLLLIPYLGLRAVSNGLVNRTLRRHALDEVSQFHDPALLLWKGLGDYDRTKGYSFDDAGGVKAMIRAAGRTDRESEVLLRSVIRRDIQADPLWYAGILAKRAIATVSLYKLWPWAPLSGSSIVPARSPNEGVTDNYYLMIAQADWVSLGPWTVEAPLALLLIPTLILLALSCVPNSAPRVGSQAAAAREALPLLACIALAVLPTPVLITTATAFEPECFVVVHLLALAFLVDGVLSLDRGRIDRASSPAAA